MKTAFWQGLCWVLILTTALIALGRWLHPATFTISTYLLSWVGLTVAAALSLWPHR